jgi:NAD(P)-dependent dehydrogenase (short-subunit alcohol dehydrogenase family)
VLTRILCLAHSLAKLLVNMITAAFDVLYAWMNMTPMNRPGVPEELQGAALYLASDASSFVTGSVITEIIFC